MNRTYFKWIIGAAALCLLIVTLFISPENPGKRGLSPKQITPRPLSPFPSYISAVGIVEASSGNVHIGARVNRVVDKIEVAVGQKVKEGTVLFRLEAEDLEADLVTRCLNYENALTNLQKLESLPRQEDVALAAARFAGAEVEWQQAESEFKRVDGLQTNGAMSQEEIAHRRFALKNAEAKRMQAEAELEKTQAGAWRPDVEIAALQVEQAKAAVQRLETDIKRTIIRSPIDGTVLQIKIHEGEFPTSDSASPPMIIGNTDKLHLRVNINQFDASFYNPKAPAVAFLQGNAEVEFPLEFVKLEPYFVSKQNLSNDIAEKVDTRVLQVLYSFKEKEQQVFVGQQMDVFIEMQNPVSP